MPNKISFKDFIRKLNILDNPILAELLYGHFIRSGLSFEDWNDEP